MPAAKPAKPQFNNLVQNQLLDAGIAFQVNYAIEHGGGGTPKAGGIAHIFNRVGKIPFQRFVKIEDKDGGASGQRSLSITPVRGSGHSIRVLLWDRKANQASTLDEISEHKVKFRVK